CSYFLPKKKSIFICFLSDFFLGSSIVFACSVSLLTTAPVFCFSSASLRFLALSRNLCICEGSVETFTVPFIDFSSLALCFAKSSLGRFLSAFNDNVVLLGVLPLSAASSSASPFALATIALK